MTACVISELYYNNESFFFLATVALSAKGPDWVILISSLTVLFVIVVIFGIAWSFRRKRRQKKGNTCIIICQFLFKINGWQEKNFVQFGCSIYFRIQFFVQNYFEDIKWSLTCKGTFNQVSKLIQDCVVLFPFAIFIIQTQNGPCTNQSNQFGRFTDFPFFWWAIVIALALPSRLSDELRSSKIKLCYWIHTTTLSPSLMTVIGPSGVQFGL